MFIGWYGTAQFGCNAMPVSSRYNKVKRNRKSDDAEERWYAPAMWSDHRSETCRAAVNSVDKVARDLENKWGIGKLQELASPSLAVKFERARQNFSDAANGDDHNYLVQKAENLIVGWQTLEKAAIKKGHKPTDAEVWFAIAPEDQGEYKFAIVKHASDVAAVDRDAHPRVYTLDEIARIISHYETSMLKTAKEIFPNSKITKIGDNNDAKTYDDPIPF